MIKIYRFFLVILVMFFQFVKAQENLFTNVQLQKWQDNYLNVETFQNGDLIEVCADTNSWKVLNNKNRPAVFVSNEGDRYYNYFAISDTRGLCPNGFRVPYYWEISDSNVDLIMKNEFVIDGEFDLRLYPKGSIDNSDGALQILNGSSNSVYIATNSKWLDEPLFYYTSAYVFKNKFTSVEEWPMPKNSGLPVICILDIEKSISDSTFNYKKLLPDSYMTTLQKMYLNVLSQFDQNSVFEVSVSGRVENSRNGEFKYSLGKIDPLEGKINENKLRLSLSSTLSEWNTVPYYKGNILMANSDFQLTFKRTVTESNFWSPFKMYNVKNYSTDNRLLLDAFERGFYLKSNSETISITDQGEIVRKESSSSVSKFKAPSQFNSAFCLLPGLGVVSTNRNSQSDRWKKVGTSFLISSISIGAISLSSKIYSNVYYSRYTYNPSSPNAESNYKKTNISQKVFLSTLGAYAVLGALDFTFTFAIGVKNKTIENQLNKQLRNGRQIILK